MARPTLAQIAAGLDVDAKSDPEDLLAILVAGTNPDGTPLTPEGRDTAAEPGTSVAIGNVSTPVVAANPDRAELTLVNDSADPIYLRLAAAGAVMNAGIRLNAAGGSYTTTHYRGAVSAIQADGIATRRLLLAEVYPVVRQPKTGGMLDPVLGVTVHPSTIAAGAGVRE